jgi:DNA-binding winged helix-turn-helix (wHTH) protein
MSKEKASVTGYRFDDIYLDVRNRQLRRNGQLLPLTSKYFDVLLLLVQHGGQLVEKQQIFAEVWNGVIVTDAALTQCIKDIRKQLGDDAANPRYIKTVPKHGYIFIGNAVEARAAEESTLSPPPSIFPHAPIDRKWERPYKFLDYYTEQDAPMFFGREPEAETICSQILAHRSFILHGRSGVGKSSIVRAGLMPRLKSHGHLAFVIRSFTDPLHQMASALAEISAAYGPPQTEGTQLDELVRQLATTSPSRSIIFFLDQFEEFFLLLGEEIRRKFVETIGKLFANDASSLRLVYVLREDLLAEMSQFKPAIPEIFHHEYRLKRLSREQATRAITEPANAVGCHYEARLVARLLDDLGEQDEVDPPQLQIVCDHLYDARDRSGKLTVAAYERLGTASRILAGYLERVLHRFKAEDLRLAKEILTALISADGQRLVLRSSALEARIRNRVTNGSSSLDALIEELIAARVVRCRNQDGEGWLELAHDFLISEVSRWQTDEERALKRARGVLERAMENYRAHQLMIDADALDLLLPFGAQLGLTGEEADLLLVSTLTRGREAPNWLVRAAPGSLDLITEAARHANPTVRLRAVEACRWRRPQETKDLLRSLALWDRALRVRKAGSIALAQAFGTEAQTILSDTIDNEKIGLIRRALSLALIRDYDKSAVRLPKLSIPVSVLILLALIWVRLRRDARDIIRRGAGGTLGGATSGLTGGLMLGMSLAMARHSTYLEATSLILVLVSLGLFISALGGFGVSFGMVTAAHVTYRHSRWWSVAGGAAGGAVIGGLVNLLGIDTLRALFGQSPTEITGAFEGAVIGAGVSLGAILAGRLITRPRPWHRILSAALGTMCAGILLTVIGGNLFSGSLELVARSFANSQMRMDPLATFFGEVRFGQTTQLVLGAMEGLLFGGGTISGMEIAARLRRVTPHL